MSKAVGMIKDPSDKNPTLDEFALDGLKQVFLHLYQILSYSYSDFFYSSPVYSTVFVENWSPEEILPKKEEAKAANFQKNTNCSMTEFRSEQFYLT